MSAIANDWLVPMSGEFKKAVLQEIIRDRKERVRDKGSLPGADDIFNAFHLTPLKDVKVVILGQDPLP